MNRTRSYTTVKNKLNLFIFNGFVLRVRFIYKHEMNRL